MDNKIMKFGYEDTDKKIEVDIYGLIFEINKSKILDKNTDVLNSKDEDVIEREIKDIIGEDSIDKINNKRKQDGYEEMTLDVEIAVLTCLFKAYIGTASDKMIDDISNTVNKYNNEEYINSRFNNRQQRRNYNKYNNRYYRR